MADKYRFVGSHAEEVHQGDKRVMIGPGEFVSMSADDQKSEHNKRLFDQGLMLAADTAGRGGGKSG